jgi:hypothetical protein
MYYKNRALIIFIIYQCVAGSTVIYIMQLIIALWICTVYARRVRDGTAGYDDGMRD